VSDSLGGNLVMDGEAGGKKSETHELHGGQHVMRKGFDFQLETDF